MKHLKTQAATLQTLLRARHPELSFQESRDKLSLWLDVFGFNGFHFSVQLTLLENIHIAKISHSDAFTPCIWEHNFETVDAVASHIAYTLES